MAVEMSHAIAIEMSHSGVVGSLNSVAVSLLVMRKLAFGCAGKTIRLVMITAHHEIDALFANEIDQTVLLSDAA
jgi:hypothetical protein